MKRDNIVIGKVYWKESPVTTGGYQADTGCIIVVDKSGWNKSGTWGHRPVRATSGKGYGVLVKRIKGACEITSAKPEDLRAWTAKVSQGDLDGFEFCATNSVVDKWTPEKAQSNIDARLKREEDERLEEERIARNTSIVADIESRAAFLGIELEELKGYRRDRVIQYEQLSVPLELIGNLLSAAAFPGLVGLDGSLLVDDEPETTDNDPALD